MKNIQQRAWLSWAVVGLLALLCGVLALLQNRWLDQLAGAEKDRLHQQLQEELNHLSRDFNSDLTAACAALLPADAQIGELGREKAYSAQYWRWKESHDRIFKRIAMIVPEENSLLFYDLNLETAQFSRQEWPAAWVWMKDDLMSKLHGRGFGPPALARDSSLIDLPRFGESPNRNEHEPGPAHRREQEWLVADLNEDYARGVMLPDLLRRHLAGAGKVNYRAEVITNGNPERVIFQSMPGQDAQRLSSPDASVDLFNANIGAFRFRAPGQPGRRSPRPGPPPDGETGRWRLLVQHQGGSLEAVVARARWQNLIISIGILILILATVVTLVRFSRRAQHLAELQMNFVAGVSHELRTPLTVIRTAAFNLRGKLSTKPDQVERYGTLIERETEKLGGLVEQILRFASTRAGQVIREREPMAVETLIEDSVHSSRRVVSSPNLVIEKHLEPGLPIILGDELAMKHVIQNLLENAFKYGTEGSNWIGVFASAVHDDGTPSIEIRVADRGPGIPLDEQEHIFDAFYRGRSAVQDQVHGTGLGLNLARKIVEAHGGTIRVKSEPMKGTEFIVRIPAASPELQDEFAHSIS